MFKKIDFKGLNYRDLDRFDSHDLKRNEMHSFYQTFDFLELGQEHSERELERALVAKIEHFLRAMGGLFAFVGSQFRMEVEGREFFVDLLLYHRRLKCLVAIELKIGEFEPEHVGKMQFYLAALDSRVRLPDENPSIGMILCKEKKRTIVE